MIRKALGKYRFWLILASLFASQVAIVGAFFLAIRLDLDPAQRSLLDQLLTQRAALMALLSLMLLTAQGLALKFLIDRYLEPMARLAEEAILVTSNPAHRVKPEGARPVRELAAKLNALAQTHQELHEGVQARIDNANRALAEEKNRLAALMSELTQSVLVCNVEGTILLYNTRARQLLENGHGTAIGLGRSLFGVLERGLIAQALEQIQRQLQHSRDTAPVSSFITALPQGRTVRAHMAPVLDGTQTLNGFVLTLEDITRMVEVESRRDGLLKLLTEDTSAALAAIREAADAAQCPNIIAVIDEESQRLASRIEQDVRQQDEAPRAPPESALHSPGRPEFYDFDLFHQAGQTAALDERLLTQLGYTVFDTETTGLHPMEGDEIIAIGAVRIVNNRLLGHENFDQLMRPSVPVRPESTAIHGIDNAMLMGRPGIEKVLPQFHRFAADTVLIAHNAAFDMTFLQMKQAQTGVRFDQPVLDTLLLSQVIHPHQKDHSLEAIAQRFGVAVVDRHTALGDSLTAGRVFLKMIPLLAEKGILTLKQAREAEQQTPYARLRY
ncbi:PAS domain S-box protein [Herbaspirillum sp. HC18]|nr:PAS domain S-box protein [Herbaspirillum sp. HC18]